jgi:hypothetical protein
MFLQDGWDAVVHREQGGYLLKIAFGVMLLVGGVALLLFSATTPIGVIEAGNGPTATPDPSPTPDPTPDPCELFKPPLPPECVATVPPRSESTKTRTPTPTSQATDVPPETVVATNTPRPASATPVGGAGAGGVSPPDTGSGPSGSGVGGMTALALLTMLGGVAAVAYGIRRR